MTAGEPARARRIVDMGLQLNPDDEHCQKLTRGRGCSLGVQPPTPGGMQRIVALQHLDARR